MSISRVEVQLLKINGGLEMKGFKKEVITVRKGDKIVDVLKNTITDVEEKFSLIYIDALLIDIGIFKKAKGFKDDEIYQAQIDGYNIIVRDYGEWFALYFFYQTESRNIYTMMNNCFDYIDGFVEGIDIYIRKWGSKAKMDED